MEDQEKQEQNTTEAQDQTVQDAPKDQQAAQPSLDMKELERIVNRSVTSQLRRAKKTAEPTEPRDEPRQEAAVTPADELKELKAEVRRLQKAKDDEERKRAEAEKEAAVVGALREAGVVNIDGAIALLERKGRVGRDKSGRLSFLERVREDVPDDSGDTVEEWRIRTHALDEGIRQWLSTDEGRHYMPPTKIGGSGTGAEASRPVRQPQKDPNSLELINRLWFGK